jgi:hypothetical protein
MTINQMHSYGQQGHIVIKSTLNRLFPASHTPTTSFTPLSLNLFNDFVVIPFVAMTLIGEDIKSSPEEGYETMRRSADFGERVFPEDDDNSEVDAIVADNDRAAAREKKDREKHEMTEAMKEVKESLVLKVFLEFGLPCAPRSL